MAGNKVEWTELPDSSNGGPIPICIPFGKALTTTGQQSILKGGLHGRMRFVGGHIQTLVHNTTAAIVAIEDPSGNDAATATASSTVGVGTEMTAGLYTIIDDTEDIVVNVTTSGGAASSYSVITYWVPA